MYLLMYVYNKQVVFEKHAFWFWTLSLQKIQTPINQSSLSSNILTPQQ